MPSWLTQTSTMRVGPLASIPWSSEKNPEGVPFTITENFGEEIEHKGNFNITTPWLWPHHHHHQHSTTLVHE